ncbi:MAG: DUF1553 domain-containing protein [Planctomycetes bacterium]|nr:DUF1553 domain-containing protein [Planctomycetota bacterium]
MESEMTTGSGENLAPVGQTVGKPSARWRKRAMFLTTMVTIAGIILWGTTARPTLMRPSQELPLQFPDDVTDIASRIDAAIEAPLNEKGVSIAERAEWNIVARRLSLAMVGNSLSLEEVRAIERIPESQRVVWWTEYLLKDRRWSDYFAERWTRATVGTNDGPFLLFRRRKYREWLSDQFQQNLPYDQLVRKLIAAKGSWTDSPEVNFLTATMDDADNRKPDIIRLAGRTSRAFLAMRIDCLQCHNDYLGNVQFTKDDSDESLRTGEQSDFHQLAAYFSGVRMENPFRGLRDYSPEYQFRYLNAESETEVEPKVPYREDISPSHATNTEISSSRDTLARWVTHVENKAFARAAVNRVWAIMLGKPLVTPVDDIPLDGPFPPGLELLADDFSRHGFDTHRLIRTIVATRVFHRDSKLQWEDANEDLAKDEDSRGPEVTQELEDAWGVFPITQLRPEQMAASIHQACRLKAIDASASIFSQLELFGGVNDFTKAYGDLGEDEFQEQSVTIPQRLLVMNGKFIRERIDNNPIMNASTRIAGLARDDKTAVESAYWSTLNRPPTIEELEYFSARLRGKSREVRSREMSNLYWVLLNSTEFQWNH